MHEARQRAAQTTLPAGPRFFSSPRLDLLADESPLRTVLTKQNPKPGKRKLKPQPGKYPQRHPVSAPRDGHRR